LHSPFAGETLKTGAMYLLDFGEFEMTDERGVAANAKSGKLWRLQLPTGWRSNHH